MNGSAPGAVDKKIPALLSQCFSQPRGRQSDGRTPPQPSPGLSRSVPMELWHAFAKWLLLLLTSRSHFILFFALSVIFFFFFSFSYFFFSTPGSSLAPAELSLVSQLHVAPCRCQCPRGSRCRSVSPLQLVGTLEGGGGHGGVAVWGPGRAHHSPCVHAGRKLPGKAGIDEVMAAAVLTSLSSSPLGLGHPPAPPGPGKSRLWGHCAPVPGCVVRT